MRAAGPSSNVLPPLPFGEAVASLSSDIDLYRDRLATVITSLKSYEALGDAQAFHSKSSVLNINGMKLVAGANTPVTADIADTGDTTLMIPFYGENLSEVEGVGYHWQAGRGAMFIPAQGRGGYSSVRANLNIDIDPARLQAVAQIMLGTSGKVPDLGLQMARVLPLHFGAFSFDAVFRHLCGIIDAHLDSPQVLELLAVDDMFYRTIVMMLRPDLFIAETSRVPPRQRRLIDPLCEYIRAHLEQPFSLSDMERISEMSARAVQYAFRERFGVTPLHWLRNERLHMAHHRLKSPMSGDSVTAIAHICGLPHLSQFAADYRKTFGESPSETLKRALRR